MEEENKDLKEVVDEFTSAEDPESEGGQNQALARQNEELRKQIRTLQEMLEDKK